MLTPQWVADLKKALDRAVAQGATEQRIRQILGEAIWLAFQQVKDPELRTWLCDEFSKTARLAPIATNHPASRKLLRPAGA